MYWTRVRKKFAKSSQPKTVRKKYAKRVQKICNTKRVTYATSSQNSSQKVRKISLHTFCIHFCIRFAYVLHTFFHTFSIRFPYARKILHTRGRAQNIFSIRLFFAYVFHTRQFRRRGAIEFGKSMQNFKLFHTRPFRRRGVSKSAKARAKYFAYVF